MSAGTNLIFDKYELVRRLAVGGMGEVFVARQVSDVVGFERHVILKSLLPDLASDPAFVEQFLDEARVAATLNHPNVVSVYEVGVSQGTYYLAMEFIPGMNLSQLRRASVAAKTPLAPELIARVIAEAAAGLHHAHIANDVNGKPLALVHRDISPHNIMVRGDGVTKVVDFGIASAANRVTRTRSGVVKGKLAYMSPEQLLSHPLDGRSDQFSLGIVLWELLTNTRLFTGDNDLRIAEAVLRAQIDPPSARGGPADLNDIVLRMLERDPGKRFASCDEVAKALEAWLKTRTAPSDRGAVAAYLTQVASAELSELNLTTPDDFVLKLKSRPEPRPTTIELSSSALTPDVSAKRSRWMTALVAAAVLAGLALAGVALVGGRQETVPPVVATVVEPKPPEVIDAGAPAPAEPATARLSISSKPSKAKLQVDGEWVGEAPLTLPVLAGVPHRIRGELDGFPNKSVEVAALDAGVLLEVQLVFERVQRKKAAPEPRPDPREPAILSVRTNPPSAIFLDGESITKGAGTVYKKAVEPGRHTLEFELNGVRTKKIIVLEPGKTLSLTPEL